MTRRLEFSAQTRRDAFARSGGVCECHRIPWLKVKCARPLSAGNIFYEHIKPCEIGGGNDLDNCAVLTKTCWRIKTDSYDRKVIAKSNHVRDRAIGIRRHASRPMPFGRADPIKMTLARGPVDRRTGQPWRGR